MKLPILCVAALILVLSPRPVQAQGFSFKDNVGKMIRKIGFHVNTSYRAPVDADVTKGVGYGASVGLSPGKTNGWRYPFALSFITQDLHGPSGEQFAVLKTRGILGGIGYGWHFGKLSTGTSLQAGYAKFSVNPHGDLLHAFEQTHGDVTMDVSNTWLLRPEGKVEYFLTPKFTVRVSGDFVYMKPDIIITTAAGRYTHDWDASSFHANFGIGVYPFRK